MPLLETISDETLPALLLYMNSDKEEQNICRSGPTYANLNMKEHFYHEYVDFLLIVFVPYKLHNT